MMENDKELKRILLQLLGYVIECFVYVLLMSIGIVFVLSILNIDVKDFVYSINVEYEIKRGNTVIYYIFIPFLLVFYNAFMDNFLEIRDFGEWLLLSFIEKIDDVTKKFRYR